MCMTKQLCLSPEMEDVAGLFSSNKNKTTSQICSVNSQACGIAKQSLESIKDKKMVTT
jgi:hypothetical protein